MNVKFVSQTFLLADPFWIRKITTYPHILTHVHTVCPDDGYPKLKINISEMISDKYQYIRNNASHDLTLIKMTVARFVGTGSSLSRHSNERIAN